MKEPALPDMQPAADADFINPRLSDSGFAILL